MTTSPREFRYPKDALFQVLNRILDEVGIGEIISWDFYREISLSEPGDESELRNEIQLIEEFDELHVGDRVLLVLRFKLKDRPASPLSAFAKFVILPDGEIKVEEVIADEVGLEDSREIEDKGKIRGWFQLGISAARLIVEILTSFLK